MYESKCSMVETGLPRSPPSAVGTTNDAVKEDVRGGLNGRKSCGIGRGKAQPTESRSETEKGVKVRRRFRCGILCLWLPKLPGLGKGKGRNRKEEEEEVAETETELEGGGCISISISRRVSLETFECGSWASSGTGRLYFDLPMELIRNSVGAQSQSQPQSPVKAAFVFDRDGRGVHLPVWTKPRLLEESCSPSPCTISPRLLKARQEFNTLLEAHTHTL